ncbi:protein-export chaperone SecB [Pantoea agglomerans]|uniref:protein-export chaperone SecB n=1 Tax=Enterobacter agglomerans TaxID=549 RepID=UPI0007E5A800|nr:protein-export chaperone SecB [Pantoea agglomerans]WHU88042.1 protein-export chaperone SecB [Pantoea agglomerans pv. gypsophilae]
MRLILKETLVNRLLLVEAEGRTIDSGFALRFKPVFNEDGKDFSVMFDFYYITESDKALRVEFQGVFRTDELIDDEFKQSRFPVVNAPAIAFPFLRAFVANFLLSIGSNPILLPSFNFTTFEADIGEFPD